MLNFQQKEKKLKKHLEVLKRSPLFEGIREGELLTMLSCLGARMGHFDKKYTILAEGSPARFIGVMLSGSAQILQIDYYGNRSILSGIRAGEVFAEAFACAETESIPISVVASEPCEVMLIDASHVMNTCKNHCAFHQRLIFNLMKDLATKTLLFHQKLEITSRKTTREKLLAYLALCAKQVGSSTFDIPFGRQELADYLEVDRSGLSTEIGKLKKEGLIENRKTRFELL